jgi:hypothetical protein
MKFARRFASKPRPLKILFAIALVLVAILAALVLTQKGGFPQFGQSSEQAQFTPSSSQSNFDFSDARLVSSNTQVFRQSFQPLVCDQGNLVYWRELRVYEMHDKNTTRTFSTISLYVKNVGNNTVKNLLVKERLPESVATTPEDIVGFNVKPFGFEKGSVVVNWLFDNIQPGETKTVSYTVEKQLNDSTLGEYQSPTAVSRTTTAATASQSFDFTLIGLVLVAVVLGGVIVFFLQGQRQ